MESLLTSRLLPAAAAATPGPTAASGPRGGRSRRPQFSTSVQGSRRRRGGRRWREAPSLARLKTELRRTSGSKVQVTIPIPRSSAQASLVKLEGKADA